ncbi:glucose-1-phosphatase [Amyelois transitella]|uniref:glucose-1-phosphatase n=1 Tax=Amyelois transitella TaxID=680683 RepID=UPI00299064C0|nr:glucose-1-phosphatase [Amyelois transitella]
MYFKFNIVLFCASAILGSIKSLNLEQVIILSRHNVRTPLSKYLHEITPKQWPKWKEKSGYLTEKGFKLEGFMGEYFSLWFKKEGLIADCPTEDDFFAYANTKQRTMASAKAFVSKCFPSCDIKIHHSNTTVDPIFNPVLHNNSVIFRDLVIEQMTEQLKHINLNFSYDFLENILEYKHSSFCIKEQKCNLKTDINKIIDIKQGFKPNLSGPLKISNSAVDAFIMENYEDFEQTAWGNLSTKDQWFAIMKLSRAFHNVIFNTTLVATDIAKPLIKYISNICHERYPKITLLMGHDANMYTVMKAMKFKPYGLKKQYEVTPVGGKIMFEKWKDEKNNRYLLRIHYVYQSTDQLRNGIELNLHNPPQFQILELSDCPLIKEGYCLWDDFVKLLKNL